MKTILVIGANGFVGTHTLEYLLKQENINVIAACRDKSKLSKKFQGEIREGDVRDEAYLKNLLKGVDVVVNAMSWTALFGQSKNSEQFFYQPTLRIIDAFLSSHAHQFINISTTSAASPDNSRDANSKGIIRPLWPHLVNVVKIEDCIRQKASKEKTFINLRLGIFVGEHYGLGILPILLPRLKTHLVPWVAGGKTELPLTDGRDIGQAMGLAALKEGLSGYQSFNVIGSEVPSVRDVILFLNQEYGYPKPHFSVPFSVAYPFAWLMEKIDPIVPWEPLIVRSIVHLLENTGADNKRATDILGYVPQVHWRDSVRAQITEMNKYQTQVMSMVKRIPTN